MKRKEWEEEKQKNSLLNPVLKMIKEDHLGDTDKPCLTVHEVGSLVLKGPENCRMGPKAGHFYRINNGQQEEKDRK